MHFRTIQILDRIVYQVYCLSMKGIIEIHLVNCENVVKFMQNNPE